MGLVDGVGVGAVVGLSVACTSATSLVLESAKRDCHPCPACISTTCTEYAPSGACDAMRTTTSKAPLLVRLASGAPVCASAAPRLYPPCASESLTSTAISTRVSGDAIYTMLIGTFAPLVFHLGTVYCRLAISTLDGVGAAEGTPVGLEVGSSDGALEGREVGALVGLGATVGLSVACTSATIRGPENANRDGHPPPARINTASTEYTPNGAWDPIRTITSSAPLLGRLVSGVFVGDSSAPKVYPPLPLASLTSTAISTKDPVMVVYAMLMDKLTPWFGHFDSWLTPSVSRILDPVGAIVGA